MKNFTTLFIFFSLFSYQIHAQQCIGISLKTHLTSEEQSEFQIVKDIFNDIEITENLYSLFKTYNKYASAEFEIKELGPIMLVSSLNDELNYNMNKQMNFPEYDKNLTKIIKAKVQRYLDRAKKYPDLNNSQIAVINVAIDFSLFLSERAQILNSIYSTLSLDEVFPIYAYTKRMFTKLNRYLYKLEPCDVEVENMKVALSHALSELSDYQGEVRRSVMGYEGFLEEHCIGCEVTYRGFTSTSTVPYGSFPFILRMTIKSGKDIALISNIPREKEILLPAGKKFKINRIEGNEIFMTEISDQ